MTISQSELFDLITVTESLMRDYAVPLRDTWDGLDGDNFDDFHENGGSYGGPRQIIACYATDDSAFSATGGKKYEIPDLKHVAYDDFSIILPPRLIGKKHPIVHELVHFLQENTSAEDAAYISFNGNNYASYLTQRVELEAHYIQCIYIYLHERHLISDENTAEIDKILGIQKSHPINIISLFNRLGII